jgi:hypothetical protein
MGGEPTSNIWVPVCCGRVMRHNMFLQQDGGGYGAFVCTVCNKNITLEPEPMANVLAYGEGSRVLNVLGSPKPPKEDRRKAAKGFDDRTL